MTRTGASSISFFLPVCATAGPIGHQASFWQAPDDACLWHLLCTMSSARLRKPSCGQDRPERLPLLQEVVAHGGCGGHPA